MNDSPNRQYEQLLHDGILAAKNGSHLLAQSLLNQALLLNPSDARPYLWLSATTEDLAERRSYLEQAVALDPTNQAARRGLALLTGKLDEKRLVKEDGTTTPPSPGAAGEAPDAAVKDAQVQSFLCPQCGGHMTFVVETSQLTCRYCGHAQAPEAAPAGENAEQVLDFVMPTTAGHHWIAGQHRLACERCGAVSLLPAGHKTTRCAYCGSNQLVETSQGGEIIDPQAIVVMKVDARQAAQAIRTWLGSGWLTPDDLLKAVKRLKLRPAYYSCWSFDGLVEVKWACEINEGTSRAPHWVARSGVEARFFDDVLAPGVKALTVQELAGVEPFNLKEALEFKPDFLAGWPALIYDRSLSDASLLAREKISRKLRSELYGLVEPGHSKRNFQASGSSWNGMTFKHLLLPLWIGTYHYRGKDFHLLVNGQTGKVGGARPRDAIKLVMLVLSAALILFLVIWLIVQGWPAPG